VNIMNNKFKGKAGLLLGMALMCAYGLGVSNSYAANEKYAKTDKLQTPAFNCTADSTWFTNPSMPTEVKQSGADGTSNFCDFYQFSWQAFAYLMASSKDAAGVRNYEDTTQFFELEIQANGSPANSCDDKHGEKTFFVRTMKPEDGGTAFLIPERIGQAGGGATIYDQNGNVVYYDVRFSKNMCDINSIKTQQNFPGGTTELKAAWKVLGPKDDKSRYITIDTQIGSDNKAVTLGMIGFHIAIATPDHPEFVWATFEHNVNVPDCVNPSSTTGWSFTSETCTTDLKNKDPLGIVQCRFNNPFAQSSLTGTPTEICREYPYGSAPGDLKYEENLGDITTLNANVQPYLTNEFAVLRNYFNLGALWLSDPTQSSIMGNQRGSLRLANSVMETDYQDVVISNNPSAFVSNCFGCHNYTGTSTPASGKNTTSGSLSHIFDDIVAGSKQCVDVQASALINSQSQAKQQCPSVCTNSSSFFSWNGQWTNQDAKTGQQLPMTVCGCCGT